MDDRPDPFLLTACYAAGQCQGDLGCPGNGTDRCYLHPAVTPAPAPGEYDDEEW